MIEVGIAEQNLVGIACGLAAVGKKPYVAAPASFLTMRSIEQIKLDAAYSHVNVKLIGISAGVSYGALGMSHHSLQDIAVMSTIPHMRIIVPADMYESKAAMHALLQDEEPCYIRVGRNPVEKVHSDAQFAFEIGRGIVLKQGDDAAIIAVGELVKEALKAAEMLAAEGIGVRVIDMPTVKPLDIALIRQAARETKAIVTMEEHSEVNGFGTMCARIVAESCPRPMKVMALADTEMIAGSSAQIFDHYGLNAVHAAAAVRELLKGA